MSSRALPGPGCQDGSADEDASVSKLGAAEFDTAAGCGVNQAFPLADGRPDERGLLQADRAAHRDGGRVQGREHRGDGDGQGVPGHEDEPDRVWVPASGEREDRRGVPRGRRAVREQPPGPGLPGPARETDPGAPGLDTVALATSAAWSVAVADRQMADLARGTMSTDDDAPIDDVPVPSPVPSVRKTNGSAPRPAPA